MYDIIVIGAGPAGLTAAIYARRAEKSVLVIEKSSFGGQMTHSPKIENYPAFSQISGLELADKMVEQALELGADIEMDEVVEVRDMGDFKKVICEGGEYDGKALIIAVGVKHRQLGLDRENELCGNGVSYCAVCDGAFYKGKTVASGEVLDVNSLYPSVMRYEILPFGEPYFYNGEYKEDKVYPLYIQRLTCSFKVKEGRIPTIQIKHSRFVDNEYLTDSGDEPVALTLTSIDLKLFFEQYDVCDLNFECGWKFKGMRGLFNEYIDKWIAVKNEATISGNKGMRQVAKILLNSLYGKFATSMDVQSKIPYLEDDIVRYKLGEKGQKDGVYLPMGAFITAYARDKTIRTSQAIKDYSIKKYGIDMYCYSDTDSIHTILPIEELKQFCEIDDVKLGAWKHESHFTKAKFIRQKTYLEEINGEVKITCAGLPQRCYDQVTWENFKEGLKVDGKLAFHHVKGGIILQETEFTIKEDQKLVKAIQKF